MTIKQLKVINTEGLSADGTFSIGLRDNLLIKPHSKVALSKFLYQGKPSNTFSVEFPETDFVFTPDAKGLTGVSFPTPPRKVTIPKALYSDVNHLMETFVGVINQSLVCGDVTGKTPYLSYLQQNSSQKTIDGGLAITSSIDEESGYVNLNYLNCPYISWDAYSDVFPIQSSNIISITGAVNGFRVKQLNQQFQVSSPVEICKGAFQAGYILNQLGRDGYDWYFGMRYMDDAFSNFLPSEDSPVRFGIKKKDDGFYLVDDGVVESSAISYTYAANDFFFFFNANGKMYLQIYSSDNTTLKYTSPAFQNYITNASISSIQYRITFCSAGQSVSGTIGAADKPLFESTQWRLMPHSAILPSLSHKRVVKIDMSNSSDLSSSLGFPVSTLTMPYASFYSWSASRDPDFNKIQDIALFWSLPVQTYIATQDKKRNSRENMIASFTPTRSGDWFSVDNLFYSEEMTYVDIGNLETLNISTIYFRVVNEYKNLQKNVPETSYLSFVLYIKDE